MKRTCWSISCGVVLLLAAGLLTGQTNPDFSGVWKPDAAGGVPPSNPPSQQAGPPPPPRTLLTTITQSATEMKVERRVETGGREAVYTFVYKLDGTESVNQMGPIVFRTKAAWEAGSLVLSSTLSAGNTSGEAREVYHLDDGDLVIESTRKLPAGIFTGKDVHKKVR